MSYKIHYQEYNSDIKISNQLKKYIKDDTIIICIGTDKCIGDCLGPLVGTMLIEKNFPIPVFGTLESPVHALNIKEKLTHINSLHPNSYIIGIDACLGENNSIGEIHIRKYPVHPGKGVGKHLPEIGDLSIVGIVESSSKNSFFTNNTIRLSLIMEMAKVITKALISSYNE